MISNVNSLGMPSAQVGLYNGNISAMATDIAYMATIGADRVVANTYKYDQLNRINNSYYNSYNNTNSTWTGGNAYATSYSYDMNGNIRSLNRSEGGGNAFDALAYQYNVDGNGRLLTDNKLGYVIDGTNYTPITTDIKTQGVGNYTYDGIGNLVGDNSEGNMNITWNVYGKIKSIRKGASAPYTYMAFSYDGAGNRVSKYVGTIDGSGNIAYTNKTTYIRDASGNIMATYDDKQVAPASGSNPAQWATSAEYPMYGSSRIGVYNQSIYDPLQVSGADDPSWLGSYRRVMRLKNYELSDHLGNVLSVITDLKRGIVDGANNFKYYSSDVVSATDYFPFGMQMPGRVYSSGAYRYGYNKGSEKDDEISGVGNMSTAKYWEYDSRLARRWNTDPIIKPWESPYSCYGDNPIKFNDPSGLTKEDRDAKRGAKEFARKTGGEYLGKHKGKEGKDEYWVDERIIGKDGSKTSTKWQQQQEEAQKGTEATANSGLYKFKSGAYEKNEKMMDAAGIGGLSQAAINTDPWSPAGIGYRLELFRMHTALSGVAGGVSVSVGHGPVASAGFNFALTGRGFGLWRTSGKGGGSEGVGISINAGPVFSVVRDPQGNPQSVPMTDFSGIGTSYDLSISGLKAISVGGTYSDNSNSSTPNVAATYQNTGASIGLGVPGTATPVTGSFQTTISTPIFILPISDN